MAALPLANSLGCIAYDDSPHQRLGTDKTLLKIMLCAVNAQTHFVFSNPLRSSKPILKTCFGLMAAMDRDAH